MLISFHYSSLCIEHHSLSCIHVNCCINIGLSSKIPLQHIILYIKSLKHSTPTFWSYKCWTYKCFILYILCYLKCSTREQYNFKICNNFNTWLNSGGSYLSTFSLRLIGQGLVWMLAMISFWSWMFWNISSGSLLSTLSPSLSSSSDGLKHNQRSIITLINLTVTW